MELNEAVLYLGTTFKVFFIDLLLSGDNAVVIALACRSLPPDVKKQAVVYGTAAAIVLRLVFAALITWLLAIPGVKLAGGLVLLVIAVKLIVSEEEREENPEGEQEEGPAIRAGSGNGGLWPAVWTVVVADAVMSLDNVVALVAASGGSFFFLMLGLGLSIPLLMYGSLFVSTLLKRFPILIMAGGALLGWIGGDIGATDVAVARLIAGHVPWLGHFLPLACAVFVILAGRAVDALRGRR